MKNLNLQELTIEEQVNTDGGIAPLILAGWGAMVLMDAVCVGLYLGYHNNK